MKLLRYGAIGSEKTGCLDQDSRIRDLSHIISDLSGETLSPNNLERLKTISLSDLPLVDSKTRIGAPITNVGKFIGIGLNYADHAIETGAEVPKEPVIFLKATSSINGPYDPIIIPKNSKHTDWEVELGIVIGTKAKRISESEAKHYIAGYLLIDDATERLYQRQTSQWAKGKSCDTFGPIGPWLVTTDEIDDPQNLNLWLEVDGIRYQQGHSKNMLFNVYFLVSYLSQYFTLYPGDIISTGTPAGIGMAQKPNPIYLKAGQIIKLGIDGLGQQEHLMINEE